MQVLAPAGGDSTNALGVSGGERVPGIHQDTSRVTGRQPPVVLIPGTGHERTLEALLAGRDSNIDVAAVVESLEAMYPQLRSLLLRENLIPSGSYTFQQQVSARDQFRRQIQQMAKLSRFQRMSLAARRYREIFEHSPKYNLMVPQVNIIRTIGWIIVELNNLLK